jgi:UDP-galactopyranose mutase
MTRRWLIVGAGLTGATLAERIATVLGDPVTVIERRSHIAGNAHDAPNAAGILIHSYGPHIFHTNSEAVWQYLQRFSAWRPFEYRALAAVDGQYVPVPFNLTSIEMLFGAAEAARLTQLLIDGHGLETKVPVLKLMEEGGALGALGRFVYEKVFLGYTVKQWALTPEQLSPSVTARVPIHISRDDRYFQDRYQALPAEGYTRLIAAMLDHPNIAVRLNTDFASLPEREQGERLIFTGPIDEFFGHRYGALPYRTTRFEQETLAQDFALPSPGVNFPDAAVPYTRKTEMKRLTGQVAPVTTIVTEYPGAHVPGATEPHYPVPTDDSRALYARYRALADERKDILFCGRLGDYRYYNMDQAVGAALSLFDNEVRAMA